MIFATQQARKDDIPKLSGIEIVKPHRDHREGRTAGMLSCGIPARYPGPLVAEFV
jgi:hypothetical protein